MHIQTLHSYRAQLLPRGMDPAEIEAAAELRLLPEVRLKAPNSTYAARAATALMGLPVHDVERIDDADHDLITALFRELA